MKRRRRRRSARLQACRRATENALPPVTSVHNVRCRSVSSRTQRVRMDTHAYMEDRRSLLDFLSRSRQSRRMLSVLLHRCCASFPLLSLFSSTLEKENKEGSPRKLSFLEPHTCMCIHFVSLHVYIHVDACMPHALRSGGRNRQHTHEVSIHRAVNPHRLLFPSRLVWFPLFWTLAFSLFLPDSFPPLETGTVVLFSWLPFSSWVLTSASSVCRF